MSKYYLYRQNNSGGVFTGPAIHVWVEAVSPEEANSIAEKHGLYFDGEGDCDCCGQRWYGAGEWDVEEVVPEWGQPEWATDGFYNGIQRQLIIKGKAE